MSLGNKGSVEEVDVETLLFVLQGKPGLVSPYVPTPVWLLNAIVATLAEIMENEKLDIFYEPGCGDGVVTAVVESKLKPRQCICLELDDALASKALDKLKLCDVVVADLRMPPLRSKPMLIYAYLLDKAVSTVYHLAPKGSILVSLEYEVEGVKPHQAIVVEGPFTIHRLLIYVKDSS